ncbi:MAG TPA: hypothetical protein VNE21_07215, partial [Mycobacteriales bacterium]|nr:hypothetical protein [Mycobacteriales bacterium]
MDREPTRAVAPTRARPSAAVYRRRRLSVLAAATAVLLLVATHGHSGGARAAKGAVPDVAAT